MTMILDGERYPIDGLPDWYIVPLDRSNRYTRRVDLEVYQEGGTTWPKNNAPRPEITVEAWGPDELAGDEGWRVSWPSTSDKRPVLARALAAALLMAAELTEG